MRKLNFKPFFLILTLFFLNVDSSFAQNKLKDNFPLENTTWFHQDSIDNAYELTFFKITKDTFGFGVFNIIEEISSAQFTYSLRKLGKVYEFEIPQPTSEASTRFFYLKQSKNSDEISMVSSSLRLNKRSLFRKRKEWVLYQNAELE